MPFFPPLGLLASAIGSQLDVPFLSVSVVVVFFVGSWFSSLVLVSVFDSFLLLSSCLFSMKVLERRNWSPQSSSSHSEAFSSFFLWFGLPGYEVLASGFERLALFMIGGGGCYFGLAVGSRSKSLRRCF
ncbi:hypothetical protein AXX17_AT3G26640 [Arabidopsis thaliana]|uniref:Transmembrane protein n=1 Tax=Arabidopsis thaliana TaxID=3702 RepID=A0A178VE28_ARATH|nr:hypothetical protein AXX17_AT3G26640 [Arabidopsis thaliana]